MFDMFKDNNKKMKKMPNKDASNQKCIAPQNGK